MTTMTIPASDAIFDAASDPPTDDERWAALRSSAVTLAESGRVLAAMERGAADRQWREMAGALVAEAEAILGIIDARDAQGLPGAGDKVYLACKACHAQYTSP